MKQTRKQKDAKEYATVADDDGVNYREIADTMTELGFVMNHSSARNYNMRIMKKFLLAFAKEYGLLLDEEHADRVARSPMFQRGVSDLLQRIEMERRRFRSKK